MNFTDIPNRTVKFAPKLNHTATSDREAAEKDGVEELVAREFPRPINITHKRPPAYVPPPDQREEFKAGYVDEKDVAITTHADTVSTLTAIPSNQETFADAYYSTTIPDKDGSLTVVSFVKTDDPVSPEEAKSNSTSMTLIVAPVFVAVGLLVIAVLFYVHCKKKSQAYKRKTRATYETYGEAYLRSLNGDFAFPGGSEHLYNKDDYSRKRYNYRPEEEILLQELGMATAAKAGCSDKGDEQQQEQQQHQQKQQLQQSTSCVIEYHSDKTRYDNSDSDDSDKGNLLFAKYADVYGDATATDMVDNELYEGTLDTLTKAPTRAERPSRQKLNHRHCVCTSKDFPPELEQYLQRVMSNDETVEPFNELNYLMPSYHRHPSPGTDWKPYHDYDPVYVPHSDPSAMARRLDQAGYVTSNHQRPGAQSDAEASTDPYEDVQVYSDIDSESVGPAKSKENATASPPPSPPIMRSLSGAGQPRSRLSSKSSLPAPSGRRAPPPTPPSEPSSPTLHVESASSDDEYASTLPPPRPARSTGHYKQLLGDTSHYRAEETEDGSTNSVMSSQEQLTDPDELYEPVTFSE